MQDADRPSPTPATSSRRANRSQGPAGGDPVTAGPRRFRDHGDEIAALMDAGKAAGEDTYVRWVQRTVFDRAAAEYAESELRRVVTRDGDFCPMRIVRRLAAQIAHIRRGGSVEYWSSTECACPGERWAVVWMGHCLGCGATDCREGGAW